MKLALSTLLIAFFAVVFASSPLAEPIIKPMKYHGPIPRSSFSLRLGFLGGATTQEMWDKLDALAIERGGNAFTDDFTNSIIVEGSLTHKLHPQFAVRATGSAAFLRSESHGQYVPPIGESPYPLRTFQRNFNVDLFTVSGDAIYYFNDASVQEFQPYVGGGFSVWIPHAVYTENLRDQWAPPLHSVDSTVVRPEYKKTKWSPEAGIQGVMGAHYYMNNNFAITAEAKLYIAQSHFSIRIPTEVGDRDANFIVDYTGFIFTVGVLRSF